MKNLMSLFFALMMLFVSCGGEEGDWGQDPSVTGATPETMAQEDAEDSDILEYLDSLALKEVNDQMESSGEIDIEGTQMEVRALTVYAFTNCGQTGRTGPTQTQCNTSYSGTTLDGAVTITSGIQEWTVPSTALYKIEAYGAQGGSDAGATGGLGAKISGELTLTAGTVIKIIVGQLGDASGGGGGSFVALSDDTALVVAGGGAGTGNGNGLPGRSTLGGGG